ncbi:MAG: ATP-grasp domain-containing protein [bacterium]|nr:ATP-grasp domain-containing protein [bacterium]
MFTKIWLPGAGGPASIGVIKSLRSASEFNFKIITTDSNPLSAGFSFSDASFVLPPITSNKWLEKALNLVKKEKIELIFPTSGFDIIPLAKNSKLFKRYKTILAFSSFRTIELCNDKYALMKFLSRDFKLAWFSNQINKVKLPCVVKPTHGKGSRDIFVCHSRSELNYAASKIIPKETLFQEYLPGTEYTIDVLSDLKGKSILAVVRVRIETRGGISSKGKVIRQKNIERQCMRIANKLKLKGITCFQMKENVKGEPMLTEINPRIGGASVISTLAGANLPLMCLKSISNEKIKMPNIKETIVLRYFEEVILKAPPGKI